MYDTNLTSKLKDSQCRVVDYGKDIAELQEEVSGLRSQVSTLIIALKQQGLFRDSTYAGWPPDSFPKSIDGFQVNYKLGD